MHQFTLIDWNALLDRYDQRQAFVEKLLKLLIDTHATTPQKLVAAAQGNDLPTLQFLAHTIKGVAGNLQASQVHELALRAEAAAHQVTQDATPLAQELAALLQQLMSEVSAHVAHNLAANDGHG